MPLRAFGQPLNQPARTERVEKLHDVVCRVLRRDGELARDDFGDPRGGGRRAEQFPYPRAHRVEHVYGLEIHHTAGDGHDECLSRDLSGHERVLLVGVLDDQADMIHLSPRFDGHDMKTARVSDHEPSPDHIRMWTPLRARIVAVETASDLTCDAAVRTVRLRRAGRSSPTSRPFRWMAMTLPTTPSALTGSSHAAFASPRS